MPLKLVTGPANSAKAGEVLGGLRARLDEEPILVVPALRDVEHAQRELAERGAVFGAQVVRFEWLFQIIAQRAGYHARVASELQRELVVERAAAAAGLEALAESARQPGFVKAAARFVAELGAAMVEHADFARALRAWQPESAPRGRYAQEISALYREYRRGLAAAGLVDPELYAWNALDALRNHPERWGRTPLYAYGFDDFTRLEFDALETVARHCEADVIVSLPFEPGRDAFKAIAELRGDLGAIAADHVHLEPVSDHYADSSRAALHHLERGLFAVDQPGRVEAGDAVRLHTAGGERAEIELVGARVLELLREGTEPGDVAIVFRDPAHYASVVDQVFTAYGIPFSVDRTLPLAHTGVGRGLLALLRCAVLGGSAQDLLAWLRTPGKLEQPALADHLEAEARREGAESAAEARKLWESRRWPLEELDRLRALAGDMPAFLTELDRQLQWLFAGPYRRRAHVLAGPEVDDARAFKHAHDAIGELRAVIEADRSVRLDHRRVHEILSALEVRVGESAQPDRVQVASPLEIRARRFEAVFLCGLQESEFPRGASPESFLPDDDRFAIAQASGLRLPLREDQLERERYLFYVCASRAERLLVLSSRYCDEEGNPQSRSFFVDDACELFDGLETTRRSLSQVTWAPDDAPTAAEWARALALAGPRIAPKGPGPIQLPALLEQLAAREVVSASALEHFADCPVKWLVDDVLRPEALEPDPEQMVRGAYAHKVLERTYTRLREETGSRRVTPANLETAERIVLEELREQRGEFKLSSRQTRVKAAVRRLEFDLLRYLRYDAGTDGAFEPAHLELKFGLGEANGAVQVAEGVKVRGMIDRVDTWDGYGLVLDYKTGKSVDSYKAASWEGENRFQAALYMLVVRELLGLEPAGGVYVPLGGESRKPRGMVSAAVSELGSEFARNDRLAPEDFEDKLDWARDRIADAVGEMRAGKLRCTPDSCAWRGGCSHPSICREED